MNKYRFMAQLLTFFISGIVHETIIGFSIGYFYPILIMLFLGPGIILIQNQKKYKVLTGNLIFWVEMYIGTAMLFSFYLVESFARHRVSNDFIESNWGSLSFLIPRTIFLGQTS